MKRRENTALFVLDAAFLVVAASAATTGNLPHIPPSLFPVLLAMAAFRSGRALAFNLIFRPLRDLLGIIIVPDESGADDRTQTTGKGVRWVLEELVTCPVCAGTWSAMLLLVVYAWYEPFGRVLLYALAAAGGAELLHWMSEMMQWYGRYSREWVGKISRERRVDEMLENLSLKEDTDGNNN